MNTTRRENWPRRAPTLALVAAASAALTALVLPLSGAARPQAAPVSTAPPTITGSAVKDQTLVAGTGSWTGTAPISFAFQWQRCNSSGAECSPIAGATGTTYTLVNADVGSRIRVQVSASNADGSASALSDATAVVTATGGPVNTGEPRITGSPVVGQTLTATNGSWTGEQPIAYAYQWVRCGADGGLPDGSNCAVISGATRTTYTLATGDAGYRIRVRVTAANSSGSTMAASNATSVVRAGAPVNTKAPSVSGSTVEGAVLAASPGTWTGSGPITYAYQWVRCTPGAACVSISGATGVQYKLAASDVGRRLKVRVTASNSGGSTAVLSGETPVVTAAGPAGMITLPSGEKSIPVSSVPKDQRLVVDRVIFTPTVVRSRIDVIGVQVRVKDTRGYVVRDAQVFIRSTPLVTRAAQSRRPTSALGYAVFQMQPTSNFPAGRGAVQFFVKAYRAGDNPLAGVAGYRLVQVRFRA